MRVIVSSSSFSVRNQGSYNLSLILYFLFSFLGLIEVFGAGSGIALHRAWKFGRMAG